MADEPKGNAPAERLVEKRTDSGAWEKVGVTTARSADAAIDQLTKKSNPDDGNEPGVYRSIPTRFISEELEVVTETRTVSTIRPASAAPVSVPAARASTPPADPAE